MQATREGEVLLDGRDGNGEGGSCVEVWPKELLQQRDHIARQQREWLLIPAGCLQLVARRRIQIESGSAEGLQRFRKRHTSSVDESHAHPLSLLDNVRS